MARNKKKFAEVFREGNLFKYEGKRLILVDTETGVNYLTWQNGNLVGGITPLLDGEGKVVISDTSGWHN